MRIKQAIIPAAGWGTRFFPFTKSVAKELVPINGTPAIEYVVREAYMAGINTIYFIINNRKEALKDYFSPIDPLARAALGNNSKALKQCAELEEMIANIHFEFIIQDEQKGLGHAILMAQQYITDDFFAVLLPDDLLFGASSYIGNLAECAQQQNACVIGVQEIDPQLSNSYGIIKIEKEITKSLVKINDLVEKPEPKNAPSHYGIIGRYILPHSIFNILLKTAPDSRGEIQLTNALQLLLNNDVILAQKLSSLHDRVDVGTPTGFLAANLFLHERLQQ